MRLIKVTAVIISAALLSCGLFGAEAKDYRKILKDKKNELSDVKKKIEQERKKISAEKKQEKLTAGSLRNIEKEIDITRKELRVFENNIGVVSGGIKEIEQRISEAEKEIKGREKDVKEMLAQQYKKKEDDYLKIILKSKDMGQLIRRYKFTKILGRKNVEKIRIYQNLVTELENDKTALVEYGDELKSLKNEKKEREKRIQNEIWRKHVTLKNIRNNINRRTQMIKELEKSAANLTKLMEKLKVSADLSDKTAAEAFGKKSGSFPWPVDSRNVLAKFGKFKHPKFGSIIYNRGIHISAKYGMAVYSIFGGVVKYADWFEGYGKMIIVQHGGGFYSVYCHLSDIKVSEGDKVLLKQVIGNTGDTESFYGDELYFEIRSAKGPLDPLKYLVR